MRALSFLPFIRKSVVRKLLVLMVMCFNGITRTTQECKPGDWSVSPKPECTKPENQCVTDVCGKRENVTIPLDAWEDGLLHVTYGESTTHFAFNGCGTTSMRRIGPVNATCFNNSLLALEFDTMATINQITVSNRNAQWKTNILVKSTSGQCPTSIYVSKIQTENNLRNVSVEVVPPKCLGWKKNILYTFDIASTDNSSLYRGHDTTLGPQYVFQNVPDGNYSVTVIAQNVCEECTVLGEETVLIGNSSSGQSSVASVVSTATIAVIAAAFFAMG